MRLDIKPADRLSMLVWRQHPGPAEDHPWRVAEAVNGCPITFGVQCATWEDAMQIASAVAAPTEEES